MHTTTFTQPLTQPTTFVKTASGFSGRFSVSPIKYHCDDYIEVPGGTESILWTDEEGQTYEIDISDLQEYDGDDGEIEYTDSKRKKTKIKCPTYNPRMIQAMMMQYMRTRVHA